MAKGCIIEKPKVLFNAKTNKLVMWPHHELIGRGYHVSHSSQEYVATAAANPQPVANKLRAIGQVRSSNRLAAALLGLP